MNIKITIAIIILFVIKAYPQNNLENDSIHVEHRKILRSYLIAGVGGIRNEINMGAGLFFPIAENILIGPRANIGNETDVLFKTPEEYIWDINLMVKYVYFISERFFLTLGAGAGYSFAQNRGKFIRTNFLLQEYEKIHSSSISLITELELNISLTKNIGIGVSGYTLFANRKTYLRYQISLFLSKIL